MGVEVITYDDVDTQARSLAVLVAAQLNTALANKARATLAVPGGTTPGLFLSALSQTDVDWSRINVLLTDERFVPETSPRSNTRLLRETLLSGSAAEANLVAMTAIAEQPEDVLEQLAQGVRAVLPLDVCVLGMGADMHIASLFPGADRLDEALNPTSGHVLLPMRAPGAPEARMTLTAPVLNAASHLHLLIVGPEKRAALGIAEQLGPTHEAPVRVALNAPNGVAVHYTERTASQ